MDIRKAVEDIWQNRKYITNDPKTAVSHLNEEVAETLKALMKGDIKKAKNELRDAMSCLFIAMKVLEVDPVEAVQSQVEQMQTKKDKIMLIKQDKAEIYVGGILKGAWSIWSEDDANDAEKLGREFGCEIQYE